MAVEEREMVQTRQFQMIVPVCMYCRSVRDEHDGWRRTDLAIYEQGNAQVSQGICPECWERLVVPQLREMGCEELAY
jgi:phosphoserine phosphatase RsbU/P